MTEFGPEYEPSDFKEPALVRLRRGFRKAKRNPLIAFVLDVFSIVAVALVLSLLIKTFLLRSFFIPSGSMEDTLQINDRIVVNELVPNVVPVNRGDVIVFRDPGQWLGVESVPEGKTPWYEWALSLFGFAAPDSNQHLIKRVIGLPGDTIKCCDAKGRLTINGVAITEPYVAKNNRPSEKKFTITLGPNKYWMMGDNRGNSADSRFHMDLPSKGQVDKSFIVGRAFLISWPFSQFGWLDNYPNVFKNVPNPKS
ncbi:MAG: hypothetical protein RLZZ626_880 [Actinomycetota bacterium]|jgi:signal peptidase I